MNKFIKIFIIIICLFSLAGCYNYKEINDAAIVSAISIDLNKDSKKYDVGVQIMNAKKKENSNISEITFYKASGKTIYEALQKTTLDSPKELYLGHNEVIIIEDELLKEKDPLSYLDYFFRDAKVEKDSLILISKDKKAYDVLKVLTPLETIPSQNLKSTLFTASNYSGITNIITLDEFISQLITGNEDAVVPSIKVEGKISNGENVENISSSDPDTKIKFDTLGVFKDNKLYGYLSEEESLGYNIIANEANETFITFKCDNKNYASIKVSSSKTDEKLKINNKKTEVEINNNIDADLIEYNCFSKLIGNKDEIKKIEKKVSNKTKKIIENTLNRLYKDYKVDSLKYGSKFYKTKYKDMKKNDLKASDIKNNINFKVSSKVTLRSTELTIKSVNKEDK